jgi:hypothetical protein
MREILKLILILTSSILFTQNVIAEDNPEIYINSQLLTQEQALTFEQLVGAPVPSGRYWLDATTGLWGYGDYPANQDASSTPEKKEYFEDRMESYGISVPSTVIYP